MNFYHQIQAKLRHSPKAWLVSGAAGFVGSHLVAKLLSLDQFVVGIDNLSTGTHANLNAVKNEVGENCWNRFSFFNGDIRSASDCQTAFARLYALSEGLSSPSSVLHQAAITSVPYSFEHPAVVADVNVTGFLNILEHAHKYEIEQVVFASSCSIYGNTDTEAAPETTSPNPLSPYAASKYANELYAKAMETNYNLKMVGLRYFNVYGARQPLNGPYSSVMTLWVKALQNGDVIKIYGDGMSSRDFCHVDDVVQANILAGTKEDLPNFCICNVGTGYSTTLISLLNTLKSKAPGTKNNFVEYLPQRPGDILHSKADISLARSLLGFEPTHTIASGLDTIITYIQPSDHEHSWVKA